MTESDYEYNYRIGREGHELLTFKVVRDTKHSVVDTGPTNYEDFIIGTPCPGTFVIYRCLQIDSCTTDPLSVDLIITSIRRTDSPACVDRGIAMAQENFPGIGFYSLPNKALNPCSKY